MIICVDFDGCVVSDARPYADVVTPLQLLPGAHAALRALKRAGHLLLLWSARANLALREDPELDPLVRAGARRVDVREWRKQRGLHRARYAQMLEFVKEELPGVFDAVDDGRQGKPMADLYLDDRAMRLGYGPTGVFWREVAGMYGHLNYDVEKPMVGRRQTG